MSRTRADDRCPDLASEQVPVPILMYHQIVARRDAAGRLAVLRDMFAAQLELLAEGGFSTITAAQLAAGLASGNVPARSVVLTFEDGFADFHARALPLLQDYGFTATVFVTSSWVSDSGAAAPPRPRPGRMLSRSQLADLVSCGIEVGAHTRGHPALDALPPSAMRAELAAGRAQLEDWLESPVAGTAYPFGFWNAQVKREAAATGHRYGCAVGNRLSGGQPDPFALPRLTIRRSTGLATFGDIVGGQQLGRHYRTDRLLARSRAAVRLGRAAAAQIRMPWPAH